jgi:hypothetical protein
MIFNEETLERAVIELFEAEQIPHCKGEKNKCQVSCAKNLTFKKQTVIEL